MISCHLNVWISLSSHIILRLVTIILRLFNALCFQVHLQEHRFRNNSTGQAVGFRTKEAIYEGGKIVVNKFLSLLNEILHDKTLT